MSDSCTDRIQTVAFGVEVAPQRPSPSLPIISHSCLILAAACPAHKRARCERQPFLDLLYMPNSESMPGISITPFQYLHRESRDGPTRARNSLLCGEKAPPPQTFSLFIQTSRHDQHPAKPGVFPWAAGARSSWIRVMEESHGGGGCFSRTAPGRLSAAGAGRTCTCTGFAFSGLVCFHSSLTLQEAAEP